MVLHAFGPGQSYGDSHSQKNRNQEAKSLSSDILFIFHPIRLSYHNPDNRDPKRDQAIK